MMILTSYMALKNGQSHKKTTRASNPVMAHLVSGQVHLKRLKKLQLRGTCLPGSTMRYKRRGRKLIKKKSSTVLVTLFLSIKFHDKSLVLTTSSKFKVVISPLKC